jgi:hypothetical protein
MQTPLSRVCTRRVNPDTSSTKRLFWIISWPIWNLLSSHHNDMANSPRPNKASGPCPAPPFRLQHILNSLYFSDVTSQVSSWSNSRDLQCALSLLPRSWVRRPCLQQLLALQWLQWPGRTG